MQPLKSKSCAQLVNYFSEIKNTQPVTVKGLYIIMSVYKIFKYIINYSYTPGSLWQYYRDEQSDLITDSESSKLKPTLTENTFTDHNNNINYIKNVTIDVPKQVCKKHNGNLSRFISKKALK